MRVFASIAITVCLLGAACGSASALSLQPIGSFERPISIVSAPTDPDRLFVAERKGRIVEAGSGGTQQFADLSSLVSCCESERGLLSIALAPDFESTARFYVAYTGTLAAGGAVGDVHVDSMRPDPLDATQLLREPILSISHADEPNHNGGQLQFGPDGKLYISTGDGGGEGDPLGNAQDTETLLGKILRIEPRPGEVPAYAIPAGNPFGGGPGRDEIWSLGLRNPWRFSFDAARGDMVIGDVGQGAREEVDLAPSPAPGLVGGAGANYGWNCDEGLIPYSGAPVECGGLSGFTEPVFDYVHQNPPDGAAFGCSIIGGYVVRDPGLGELIGRYLYVDYCVGTIRSLVLPASAGGAAGGDRGEGLVVKKPTSLGQDSCGRLYLATDSGPVYRFVSAVATECPPGPSAAVPSASSAAAPRRVRLLLRRRDAGKHRIELVVRARPCVGLAGARVQLNRSGERFAGRRLDRRCVARFSLRLTEAATFRALLRASPEVRSRRLRLAPPTRRG